jgi:diguanylate cyclase
VANRLRGTLRKSDTLARTGGDEFVMIVDEIDSIAQVEMLAQRVVSAFTKPFHILSVDIHTAPSIGISMSCTPTRRCITPRKSVATRSRSSRRQ